MYTLSRTGMRDTALLIGTVISRLSRLLHAISSGIVESWGNAISLASFPVSMHCQPFFACWEKKNFFKHAKKKLAVETGNEAREMAGVLSGTRIVVIFIKAINSPLRQLLNL